ncbi:MAG: PQQ-dependent dehydrogenase, methanol/ethanol family [Gemmatimonadales bacterium]
MAGPVAAQGSGDWITYGGNDWNQRYSTLRTITTANVSQLVPRMVFQTGIAKLGSFENTPIVTNGIMYVTTPYNTAMAYDLTNHKELWRYEHKLGTTIYCCGPNNRGFAIHGGAHLYMGTLDAHLVALNAKDGSVAWTAKNGDPAKGQTGTSAAAVIKDKVIVGISGGEFGVQCHVTAYDLKTGKQVWRAFSEGPDDQILVDPQKTTEHGKPVGADSSLKTWQGDQWKIGGGCTWGWISYDPQLNLFYYGSGNPSTWNPKQRPGDNKWSMTIWARSPDDGKARWVYQMTPHDEWDYDGINEMILADVNMNGQARKILVHFDRNGFGYTLDRTNGKVLVAQPYGPVNWAKRVDLTTGVPEKDPKYGTTAKKNTEGICPAAIGFKDQQPAAYSPVTGLFYVPANHICMDYEGVEVKYTAGQPYVGAIVRMFPGPGGHRGNFIAWDPMKGKAVWSNKENLAAYGGALTTATGLVFYGTMEGWLKALDAKTGKSLWQFKTPSGIIGNPMTYNGPDGQQYVAVLSGIGGWAGIGVAAGIGAEDPTAGLGALGAFGDAGNFSNQGGVLTVFGLKNQPVK